MNWMIYGIEILVMIICFSLLVTIPMTINPVSFISDFPFEIQQEYYKSQGLEKKKETLSRLMIIKKLIALIVCLFVCAWLAHLTGAHTFFQGFLLSFSYVVIIAAFDTFIIDWIFFPRIKRWRLPGTEHMDNEYQQKWFHLKGVLKVFPLGIVFAIISGVIMMFLF